MLHLTIILRQYANISYEHSIAHLTQGIKPFLSPQGEELHMNDVETAYYIDVQARVSKKLLEVS